ncbi:hypothetical protein BD779DRAFT_1490313 [Infundibulicybe gibba]|nr:hypothetical protein BD779DRAFT_1490313 [Infundibulicybe gibba]
MNSDLHDRNFYITFEEDDDAGQEEFDFSAYRSRSWGVAARNVASDDAAQLPPEYPDPVLTETEIGDSFLSASFTTIQPLDDHKSLLVLVVRCHPAPGRRFLNATIKWKFKPHTDPQATTRQRPPRAIALAPEHTVGGWSEEQTKLVWGLAAPLEVGFSGVSVGVEASREKETSKAVMHAMTIIGTPRSGGMRCVWTIVENKSSGRAVVLDHEGPFETTLDVKAELGGKFWPTYIQAKKANNGEGMKKVIDVKRWKCGEATWEPGELGWKKFMAGFSGEVSGVMHEFEQAIVSP